MMDDLIKFLNGIDWDKYRVVINIAGGVVYAGKEIVDILKRSGMNQIEYIEIVTEIDAEKAINRARLIKAIENA